MSLGSETRPRKASWTLVVTFVLGIAIGFSLFYALADALGWDFSAAPYTPPRPAAGPQAPSTQAKTAETEALAPPAPEAPAEGAVATARTACPERHLFVGVDGNELDASTEALLREFKPRGVVLLSRDLKDERQAAELVRQLKAAAGSSGGLADPPLVAVAQEGGPDYNPFGLENAPSAAELGEADDAVKTREAAIGYAAAARARGIAVVLAPVLDIRKQGAVDPSFAARAFSGTPDVAARVGLDFAQALLDGGVAPVVKYYPGLSAAVRLGNGALVIPRSGTSEQDEMYALAQLLFPFSEAAGRGLPAMLVAHVAVPALDKDDPKRPASFSPVLIQKVVRETWAYQGVLLADDVTAASIAATFSPEEAAVRALAAGCDAVLVHKANRSTLEAICHAITSACEEPGGLTQERLAESAARLDAWNAILARPALQQEPVVPAERPSEAPEEERIDEAIAKEGEMPEAGVPAEAPSEAAPEDVPEGVPSETETPEEGEVEAEGAEEAIPEAGAPPEGETTAALEEAEKALAEGEEPAPAEGEEPAPAEGEEPALTEGEEPAPAEGEAGEGAGKETLEAELAEDRPPAAEAAPPAQEKPAEDAEGQMAPEGPPEPVPQPPGTTKTIHRIRRGENLIAIAKKYGVGVSDIKAWNGLTDSKILYGQKLLIYVLEKETEPEPSTAETSPEGAPESGGEEGEAPLSSAPTFAPAGTGKHAQTVRAGETLAAIAATCLGVV